MLKIASESFTDALKSQIGLSKPGLRVKENEDGSVSIEGYGDHNILKDVYTAAMGLDNDPGHHKRNALLGIGAAVASAGAGTLLKNKLGITKQNPGKISPLTAAASLAIPVGAYYAMQNASDRPGRAALGGVASALSLAALANGAPKSTLTGGQRAAQAFATLAPTAAAVYGVHQLQKAENESRLKQLKDATGLDEATREKEINKIKNKEDLLVRYPLLRVAPYSEKLRTKLSSSEEDTVQTESGNKDLGKEWKDERSKGIKNYKKFLLTSVPMLAGDIPKKLTTKEQPLSATKPHIDDFLSRLGANIKQDAGYAIAFHNPHNGASTILTMGKTDYRGKTPFSSYTSMLDTDYDKVPGIDAKKAFPSKDYCDYIHLNSDDVNTGTLAHEIGHHTGLGNKTNSLRGILDSKLPTVKHKGMPYFAHEYAPYLGAASAATLAYTNHSKLGLGAAALGALPSIPRVINEMAASYEGSKMMPKGVKNKLSPWAGVPTYLAAPALPFVGYYAGKAFRHLKNMHDAKKQQEKEIHEQTK